MGVIVTMLGGWLDWMISQVSSNLDDSMVRARPGAVVGGWGTGDRLRSAFSSTRACGWADTPTSLEAMRTGEHEFSGRGGTELFHWGK